jgi:2-polyprenyl-6-methoxyphenol hydroxylase-like FAD-dependent oxidoreductase
MSIAIVGGGIAGLALALNLHKRGIDCHVYEVAPEIKALGVGITLLPHAMRELTALGLQDELRAVAIENKESRFFNRFGQLIYREPRGKYAGYPFPEFGIHRGRLHLVLYDAARAVLDDAKITTNHRCVGLEQNDHGVTIHFQETTTGKALDPVRADIAIGCDGVNSAVRRVFYPDEQVCFTGINTWRGVTRLEPIFDGRTYVRIGSIKTAKMVIYPIIDNVDGDGRQLINWVAEVTSETQSRNDWNQPGKLEEFYHYYEKWSFDWLDVAGMIRSADTILEYPMVDKDPVGRWTFGRVTLTGDAAHPMYPRGSNGAAQALIDVRILADFLHELRNPLEALEAYETARLGTTSEIVRANRVIPPDTIMDKVQTLTGDKPFENLDDFITQEELREVSKQYQRVAGFRIEDVR